MFIRQFKKAISCFKIEVFSLLFFSVFLLCYLCLYLCLLCFFYYFLFALLTVIGTTKWQIGHILLKRRILNYLNYLNYLELSRVPRPTCNTQDNFCLYLGTFILTKPKFHLWCYWIIWLSATISSIKLTDHICAFSQCGSGIRFSQILWKRYLYLELQVCSNVHEKPCPCRTFWITCKIDF